MKKFVYTFIFICTLGLGACHNGSGSSVAEISDADTTTLKHCLDSATVLFQNGNYEQSLVMAKQALEIGRALNDTLNISDALSYVLSDYQQLGVLDSAITIARELIELDKIDGDAMLLSNDYNNLAYIYMGNKQYDLAREFIEKAIELELQVEPLRAQSEKAKKYLIFRDELPRTLVGKVAFRVLEEEAEQELKQS